MLERVVESLESDTLLFRPDQLGRRLQALHSLDACLPHWRDLTEGDDQALYRRAMDLTHRLEAANQELYQLIRSEIQLGRGADALDFCFGGDER